MVDELNFNGKTVLVIGGSSGIGNGIAQRFRRHGAEVYVWGTRPSAEDYDIAEGSNLGGLHYSQVDVRDRERVARRPPEFKSLDVLVQSQGTVLYGGAEFERPGWDAVTTLNLDTLMDCAIKFRSMLAEQRGSLIIVSSVSGFVTNSGNPAYSASKAAAVSLTRSLARAWASDGVRVNGIAPGLVDTKLTRIATDDPVAMEKVLQIIPAGYVGSPDEMGRVALFLASSLASYVVGQTIVADGGMTISRALDAALAK